MILQMKQKTNFEKWDRAPLSIEYMGWFQSVTKIKTKQNKQTNKTKQKTLLQKREGKNFVCFNRREKKPEMLVQESPLRTSCDEVYLFTVL